MLGLPSEACSVDGWIERFLRAVAGAGDGKRHYVSLLKGLVAGITTGMFRSECIRWWWNSGGHRIAAVLSLLVVLRAGMALFWDIMVPGMLLGAIVGFATQRFGRKSEPAAAAR